MARLRPLPDAAQPGRRRADRRSQTRSFGSFARLVADKGLAHERELSRGLPCQGEVHPRGLRRRRQGESFADWVARVGNPLDQDYDVVYQMPFVHDGIRGIADFLVRVDDPETGAVSLRAGRRQARPRRGQAGPRLAAVLLRRRPRGAHRHPARTMHIWLGSGQLETSARRRVSAVLAPAARPACRR